MSVDLSRTRWRKSSRSNTGSSGNCVEVSFAATMTAVRDSKQPEGPVLVFSTAQWRRFLDAARRGALG
ncbi:DUF397 domain-containing protein [Saccharopolyspora taberi]|uniref:DUF397 domain-containing protein n=1 Tax=Saccharopolyspora taberi TaxID=60895 RepID=A0ABN3V8Y7_9PSEU